MVEVEVERWRLEKLSILVKRKRPSKKCCDFWIGIVPNLLCWVNVGMLLP